MGEVADLNAKMVKSKLSLNWARARKNVVVGRRSFADDPDDSPLYALTSCYRIYLLLCPVSRLTNALKVHV